MYKYNDKMLQFGCNLFIILVALALDTKTIAPYIRKCVQCILRVTLWITAYVSVEGQNDSPVSHGIIVVSDFAQCIRVMRHLSMFSVINAKITVPKNKINVVICDLIDIMSDDSCITASPNSNIIIVFEHSNAIEELVRHHTASEHPFYTISEGGRFTRMEVPSTPLDQGPVEIG